MPGYGLFDDFLISVTDPGKPYSVPVITFGKYVKKLNPACSALDAVALHAVPPSFLLSEQVHAILKV